MHHSRLAIRFHNSFPVSTTTAKKPTFRLISTANGIYIRKAKTFLRWFDSVTSRIHSQNLTQNLSLTPRNCPICMDPLLQDDQTAKYLSCAHAFHEPCIDRWLVDKTTCPVCRNQELKPPPIPPPARQWHILPPMMRGAIGSTIITTEVLPSAVRPRQQSVHGRRRARRRGAATGGQSRSRSRGARSRSRAPSAAAGSNSGQPPSGHDLV